MKMKLSNPLSWPRRIFSYINGFRSRTKVNEDSGRYLPGKEKMYGEEEAETFYFKGMRYFATFRPFIRVNLANKTIEVQKERSHGPFVENISDLMVEVPHKWFSRCVIKNRATGAIREFKLQRCEVFKQLMDQLR